MLQKHKISLIVNRFVKKNHKKDSPLSQRGTQTKLKLNMLELHFFINPLTNSKFFCIFAEILKLKYMNRELIIKQRSLRENRRSFNNYVLEKELKNSVSPEEFRTKLVECVVKQYENVQC